MDHEHKHLGAFLLLILTTSLITHTYALPLPLVPIIEQQIVLQSISAIGSPLSPIASSTASNFIPTQTHLSLLPELLEDAEPLSDPFSSVSLTSLRSPGKGRPGRPGSHADVHGGRSFGFGRMTIWNPWSWRSDLKKGEGCRWHSYRKDVVEQLSVVETAERVEVTLKEPVSGIVEAAAEGMVSGMNEKVQEEAKVEAAADKDEHSAKDTTSRIPLLEALLGEELFTTPTTSSRSIRSTPSSTKAMITLDGEPSHTQLDQSAFPSGLKSHLVPIERVPMVEFVKAVE